MCSYMWQGVRDMQQTPVSDMDKDSRLASTIEPWMGQQDQQE